MTTSFATLILIFYHCISLASSVNVTDCQYLYVKPETFRYYGWYQHSEDDKKFGHSYWSHLSHPHIIQLLIYQNQWYFYNWDNKDQSYILESISTENNNDLELPTSSNSTWDYLQDGTSTTLEIVCWNELNPSIGNIPTPQTTLIPNDEQIEQIEWLINGENCHSKPRGYIAFISDDNDDTLIETYWDNPILSNHSSNITISISGNSNDNNKFTLGQHQITYAAKNDKYLFLCQVTIYIIGMYTLNIIYITKYYVVCTI